MSTPSDAPTVLIVEDHADTREMLSLAFQSAGFRVCEAGTVAEAIRCVRDEVVPSVILSDVAMPNASGVEFIKYLREDATLSRIPVIVVTGRTPSEVPVEAYAVLQKPVDPFALVETAKAVLANVG